jgi:hypothetical protein
LHPIGRARDLALAAPGFIAMRSPRIAVRELSGKDRSACGGMPTKVIPAARGWVAAGIG